MKHVELFWDVDFNKQTISGEAILHFNIVAKEIERIVSLRHVYDLFEVHVNFIVSLAQVALFLDFLVARCK